MPILAALESLDRRRYGGWDEVRIEWEGPPMSPRFRAWAQGLRKRHPDAERRAGDSAWESEAFLYHFLLGLRHGYPECCVLAYAMEAPGLPVLWERRVGFGEYVPCPACLQGFLDRYLSDSASAAEGAFPIAPA